MTTPIQIVTEIGQAAIELEHRPDIDIRWDQLRIFMTTPTAGDVVTELDSVSPAGAEFAWNGTTRVLVSERSQWPGARPYQPLRRA